MLAMGRRVWRRRGVVVGCALFVLMAGTAAAGADEPLKTVHNPGGGEIAYGPVAGQATLPATMGYILGRIHRHFGERPQVGRVFYAKGSPDTMAASFQLTARMNGSGPISGLVIVAMPAGQQPSVAVLYDQADRFRTTFNPMMKTLDSAWRADDARNVSAAAAASPSGLGGAAGSARPLRTAVFPDNSGSIGLPEGWQIQSAHQGAVTAQGPNNESLNLGVFIPMIDTGNPQKQQMVQMQTQGGRRPLPGKELAAPYGMEPFELMKSISDQINAKQNKPPATTELISATPSGGKCTNLKMRVDQHDGKGMMYVESAMCVMAPYMPGSYAVTVNQLAIPESRMAADMATMRAMNASYQVNNGVVNAEAKQNVQQMQAAADQAQRNVAGMEAASQSRMESMRRMEDGSARRTQAFSNYLREQSVVKDNDWNAHGTIDNDAAEALVKADPNRFEYVPTQDYLKGIDY